MLVGVLVGVRQVSILGDVTLEGQMLAMTRVSATDALLIKHMRDMTQGQHYSR